MVRKSPQIMKQGFHRNSLLVSRSNEPGWLVGTLNGKSGLIPENYVEILN